MTELDPRLEQKADLLADEILAFCRYYVVEKDAKLPGPRDCIVTTLAVLRSAGILTQQTINQAIVFLSGDDQPDR